MLKSRLNRTLVVGTLGLMTLTACAGLGPGGGDRATVSEYLSALRTHQEAGQTGTITGRLYLAQPGVPTPLLDWAVTLLPLSPEQETALERARAPYLDGDRTPLSPEQFATSRQVIEGLRVAADPRGEAGLIRTATTNRVDAAFTFNDVPEGRWLLTAELPGKLSTLLWAVPVSVTAGKSTVSLLNDSAVWLEGLNR